MRTALFLLVGCGRIGFDATSNPQIDADIDIPIDAPLPTGPFGTAMPLPGINTGSGEDDPSLTPDLLEIFFDSDRAGGMGGGDLWTASRNSPTDPFGAATNLTVLNTAGDDATPDISADGLTLHFVSTRAGSLGQKDIYRATRAARGQPWSTPIHVPELSSTGDEAGPAISYDGLAIVWATNTTGNDDIYIAIRDVASAGWSAPQRVTELATTSGDTEPWINSLRRFIVFSSNRTGNSNLFSARRASVLDPWSQVAPIAELNTNAEETDPWLSPDEHVIVFGRGNDIFFATR